MQAIVIGALAFSIAYTIVAALRVALLRPKRGGETDLPAVTIAKPLCGNEPRLEENLRSFLALDYPQYEVIFGVASEDDPAAAVARRIAEGSGGRASLVVEPDIVAANRKVNTLIAIARRAKFPVIAVADSDVRVGRGDLRRLVAAFDDDGIGAVASLYRGRPAAGFASRLAAMYVNESFIPSVLTATALAAPDFLLGAMLAVRRDALDAIGGFESLAADLADDYSLGRRLRQHGYALRIADTIVETTAAETTVAEVMQHELRWSRTIRSVRPLGHAATILTMPLVWAVVSLAAAPSFALIAAAVAARLALHAAARARLGRSASAFAVPIRDALTFAVYCASFFGRSVVWRDRRFAVSSNGTLEDARRLIITGDDFGLSVPVNEAIERAHTEGVLTSASLMVGGPAAADAIARAKRLPSLRVGLHVVVVRGRPLLPDEKVRAITRRDGTLLDDLFRAGVCFFFSRAARRALEAEIRAQFEAFAATGLPLDHADAHNHMHCHPTVFSMIVRAGRDFGLRAVRIPSEPLRVAPLAFLRTASLWPWLALMRVRAHRAGLVTNDTVIGVSDSGSMTRERFIELIERLPAGASEAYFHPAARSWDERDPLTAGYRRQDELDALTSADVALALRRCGVRPTTYSEL